MQRSDGGHNWHVRFHTNKTVWDSAILTAAIIRNDIRSHVDIFLKSEQREYWATFKSTSNSLLLEGTENLWLTGHFCTLIIHLHFRVLKRQKGSSNKLPMKHIFSWLMMDLRFLPALQQLKIHWKLTIKPIGFKGRTSVLLTRGLGSKWTRPRCNQQSLKWKFLSPTFHLTHTVWSFLSLSYFIVTLFCQKF